MDPSFLSEFLKIVKHPKRRVLSFASRPNDEAVQDVPPLLFNKTLYMCV